ncbi:MAG: tetracycline resistance MFS efflux pump [Fimbriimonadales bacterium]|nr:MAG: tetracycline resistance MFS efflux pump [Fimbriimonadales bacterium]
MRTSRITPESDEGSRRRALLAVFLTIFVSLVGFGIVIPLLPFYAQKFQASELEIGLLFASFSAAQLLAAPILGDWSDRYGRRPVLILSLLGSAASFVMLALAPNMLWLFLSRVLDGFTGGNITTARAYIADISPPEKRAKNFGLIGAAFGLGFILGPALGGGLAHFGLAVPAWAAAAMSLLAAGYAFFALPETAHLTHAKRPSPWREMPITLTRSAVARLLWVNFILWVGFSIYQTTFPLFAHLRFGLGTVQIGYVLAIVGAVSALSQVLLVGRVVHRFGEKHTLLAGVLLNIIGLTGAAFTHSLPLFYLLVGVASVGGSLALPSLTSLISQSAAPVEQGRVQGVAGSLESFARIVAPIWGNGALGYSSALPYASAAALLVVAGLILLGLRPAVPPRNPLRS